MIRLIFFFQWCPPQEAGLRGFHRGQEGPGDFEKGLQVPLSQGGPGQPHPPAEKDQGAQGQRRLGRPQGSDPLHEHGDASQNSE